MAHSPETPAEFERQAEYFAKIVKEEMRRERRETLIEDADGLAKILKVSRATIERKTRDGTIPSFKLGDSRRYDVQRVIDHLHNAASKPKNG